MTAAINIKAEVESVLGRELIGHERAIVVTFFRQGMLNPRDIARTMLAQHVANVQRTIDSHTAELNRQKEALAALDAEPVEVVEQPIHTHYYMNKARAAISCEIMHGNGDTTFKNAGLTHEQYSMVKATLDGIDSTVDIGDREKVRQFILTALFFCNE